PALRAAGVRTVLARANHPDTDAPDWFYADWEEVFDARPQEEDRSPLDALLRALPAVLDRLAAGPDFLLWVEIDRLPPPWEIPQDVFEAYLDVGEEAEEEEENEQDLEDEEEPDQDDESEEDDEVVEEDSGVEESNAAEPVPSTEHSAPPEEPVTPWAGPPTGPFDAADPAAWEWLHNSFAALVTTLDAELGAAFDQLRARGLDKSAAWVLTSDYGHPLGEHGQVGLHRPWLHEELVHLPLILRLPGGAEAGRR